MKTCPACGATALKADTRDIAYTSKGEATSIPVVKGEFCGQCGESVIDPTDAERVSEAMLAYGVSEAS